MQLLDRTREGPKLTDAGQVLVAHAEAAIARLEEAERELAAIAGLEGGELRMASFPSASATLLTEAVSRFHARHPKVRLSIADAEPEESLPGLRAGELDLALTFDYPSIPTEGERDLDRTLLLTESMHLALPADHPLASRSTRAAGRARGDELALRLAAEHLRRGGARGLPLGGLRARGRLRVRRLQRHAGVHRRRARGDAAARPRAAHAPPGPGRPADGPAGPEAARLGRDPAEGARSPATDEMVATLAEVGEAFAQRNREPSACALGSPSPRRDGAVGRRVAGASATRACQCWSTGFW